MNYRLSSLIVVTSIALGGCQGNPGGLSDAEFNRLSPDRKAELRMEQETLNEERTRRIEHEMDSYDRNSSHNSLNDEARKDMNEAMRGKDLSGLENLK